MRAPQVTSNADARAAHHNARKRLNRVAKLLPFLESSGAPEWATNAVEQTARTKLSGPDIEALVAVLKAFAKPRSTAPEDSQGSQRENRTDAGSVE